MIKTYQPYIYTAYQQLLNQFDSLPANYVLDRYKQGTESPVNFYIAPGCSTELTNRENFLLCVPYDYALWLIDSAYHSDSLPNIVDLLPRLDLLPLDELKETHEEHRLELLSNNLKALESTLDEAIK